MNTSIKKSGLLLVLILIVSLCGCDKNEIGIKNYEGDIALVSQDEVNSFGRAGYDIINGSIRIGNEYGIYGSVGAKTDISSLAPLNKITQIQGALTIVNNPELKSLEGLSSLISVRGLTIDSNRSLESLSMISNLKSIEEDLMITKNESLRSFRGLEGLTKIDSAFHIEGNKSLVDFEGLEMIQSIGFLSVRRNESLASLDNLENLIALNSLSISHNPSITSLNAFRNITVLSGNLGLETNASLLSLDGLNNIVTIEGFLGIYNTSLTSLAELKSLRTIGRSLYITKNDQLISLEGLNQITSIGGYGLEIENNPSLNSLDALSNLDFVKNKIVIFNNPSLFDFCPLVKVLNNQSFSAYGGDIRKNGFNPSSLEIVEQECNP